MNINAEKYHNNNTYQLLIFHINYLENIYIYIYDYQKSSNKTYSKFLLFVRNLCFSLDHHLIIKLNHIEKKLFKVVILVIFKIVLENLFL